MTRTAEFPYIEFVAADSVLQGFEAHADIRLASAFDLELGMDYVRGALKDSGEPLPRIPPLRGRFGLKYQRNALQLGGEVVGRLEAGPGLRRRDPDRRLRAAQVVRLLLVRTGGVTSTMTARLDNATNELYRNHLSLIKDFVPEMGRNFKLVYSVKF